MDAEERFHQKRMGCVKYCIHVKNNIPLDLISMNWTLKHELIKGQIVVKTCQSGRVKTCQSGSLKYIKYQDIETEVEGQMEKCQSKNSSQRLWAVERWDKNEEMKEILRVVKCTLRHRKIKEATEAQVKEAAGTSSKKLTVTFQHAWDKKNNNDDNTRENEDLKEKGGGRLQHYNVDGDVPLCLRKTEEKKAKTAAAAIKRTTKKKWNGSSTLNNMKDGSKSKMASGSKDMCGDSTEKKNNESGKTKNKDITFIMLQKTWDQCTQVKELKKWHASLRAADGMQYYWAKRGDKTSQKSGRHITNTCSWEQERTTTKTVLELCWTKSGGKESHRIHQRTCHHHHDNTSNWWVCTAPTRDMRTITLKKCTDQVINTRQIAKQLPYLLLEETSMLSWDLVGWCCKATQHSTRCTEKTPQKQTTFRSPKGNEKQIDYNKDAEANDMIYMGSDHRCVMETFTITTPE